MRFYDYLSETPVAFLAVIWLTDKQNQYEWKKKLNQKLIKSFKQIFWSILETYIPGPQKKKNLQWVEWPKFKEKPPPKH